MGDLLGRASDWVQAKRAEHLATTVKYHRGSEVMDDVGASVGRKATEDTDESGIQQVVVSRDYLILADDLDRMGEPRVGDRIEEAGVFYEVGRIPGGQHWEWSDRNRKTYRIHTKEVAG